jgi:hypothetical protein
MKVPTKHGLDRKFKPWRKGKSSNSNKRSSLKQQLRGHERLLAKIEKSGNDKEKTEELRMKIAALKSEISQKQQSMVEKKHAEKAHGQRFLDRQKLTREVKKVKKSDSSSKGKELLKLALDQVYVAHHPNDVKYMPLFKHGKRVVDQSRQLFRRAVTRKRILRDIETATKVNWIEADQYERLPKDEWKIQDEEKVFGGSVSRSNTDKKASVAKTEDSRFAMASSHEALLKAAEQAESEFLKEGDKMDTSDTSEEKEKVAKKDDDSSSSDSSSDDSSDSEDDKVDPLAKPNQSVSKDESSNTNEQNKDDGSNSSSDSSSDDDSDSDDDKAKPLPSKAKTSNESDSSSSDSDTSSDSDSSSDDEEEKPSAKPNRHTPIPVEEVVEVDDFLVDATDDVDVFKNPAVQVPAMSEVRGDKSKGFETQSQRPGEYRKKRIRRY